MPAQNPTDAPEPIIEIGRYEILAEIGRSTEAVVYQARDTAKDCKVAVKLFHAKMYSDPTVIARYQREAQLIASLQNPAIVSMPSGSDFGEYDERPYIVMPWMPGGSLADLLLERTVTPEEALAVLEPIASALDAVHALGIVHGNIKPSNILFDEQGQACLSDFGMLKLAETMQSAAQIGAAAVFLGPPAYISPEQVQRGAVPDGRSDQYMLGVVLVEMLSGQNPFASETSLGYAVQKLTGQVAALQGSAKSQLGVFTLPANLPKPFAAAIKRALEKSAEQRFDTVQEFVDALKGGTSRRVSTADTVNIPMPVRSSRFKPALDEKLAQRQAEKPRGGCVLRALKSALVLTVLLVLAAAGGYAGLYYLRPDLLKALNLPGVAAYFSGASATNTVTPQPAPTQTARPTFTPTKTVTRTPLAASPTPTLPATVTPTAAAAALPPAPTTIFAPEVAEANYAVTSLDTLFQIAGNFKLGYEQFLDTNALSCSSRLPIGVSLAIPEQPAVPYDLFPAPLAVGTSEQLQLLTTLPCMREISALDFSPDGQYLAAAMGDAVYIWHVGDWRPVYHLRGHGARVTSLDFSSDGHYLATGGEDTTVRLWRMSDGKQEKVYYEHSQTVTGIAFHPSQLYWISVSADGRVIRWSPQGRDTYIVVEPAYSVTVSPRDGLVAVGYETAVAFYDWENLDEVVRFAIKQPVDQIAYSQDGLLLASSRFLWHVDEQKQLYSFDYPNAGVAFSADRQVLAIGTDFWNVANGLLLSSLPQAAGAPAAAGQSQSALTTDASLFAWGNGEQLSIWGLPVEYAPPEPASSLQHVVEEGDTFFSIANQSQVSLLSLREINGLACSSPIFVSQFLWIPDQPQAALTFNTTVLPRIEAGNLAGLQNLRSLEMDCVLGLSDIFISEDQRYLISGSAVWDLSTGAVVVQAADVPRKLDHTPERDLNSPIMTFLPNPDQAAMRLGQDVLLWDLLSGRLQRTLQGHTGVVTSVTVSPDGKLLASGSGVDERSVRLWDAATGALVLRMDSYITEDLLFTPDSKMLYQVGSGALRIYRVGESVEYRTLLGIGSDFSFSPDRSKLAYTVCTSRSGENCLANYVNIYTVNDQSSRAYSSSLAPTAQGVVFSPDGTALAAASGSGVVIWNVEDSTLRFSQRLQDTNQPVLWVSFSPRGDLLLAYDGQKRLHFWDLSSGELIHTISDIEVERLTWAPDSTFLAILSGGKNSQVQLWGVVP